MAETSFVEDTESFIRASFTQQGNKYIPWLQSRVSQLGGTFQRKHVKNFNDLDDFDVIVNCSGIGAAQLANDPALHPVRGALIEVEAPWLKQFVFAGVGDLTYVIPGKDSVFLGCVRQPNRVDMNMTHEDRQDIWQRCSVVISSLKNAKVKNEWVGLRPSRYEPRVEAERVSSTAKIANVIHNYGHGGNGFTLSWGCGQEVVRLLQNQHRIAKL